MTEFIIKDLNIIQKLDQLNEKELEKLSEVLEEEIPKLRVSQTPTGVYALHKPLQGVAYIAEKSQMTELAKRAVACKNWKWMAGMQAKHPDTEYTQRIVTITQNGFPYGAFDGIHGNTSRELLADCLPVLTDPATIGCLLALVREVWHTAPANVNCHMSYSPDEGHYRYWTCSYSTGESWEQTQGKTEAEALILALEASSVWESNA